MNKIIPFILLFLLCLPAHAANLSIIGGGVSAPAASCSTSNDGLLVDLTGTYNSYAGETYAADKITISATTTITEYTAIVCNGSSYITLYNDDGNGATSKPTTEVSNSRGATFASPACPDYAATKSTLSSPLSGVVAGTYWIVSVTTAGTRVVTYNSNTNKRNCYSSDGTNWACGNDSPYDYTLYGCQ